MNKKLEVPYVSQYRDVQNPDYRLRSCGMTCVNMVLQYFKTALPTLDEMIGHGMEHGGYSTSGWKHDYFVNLIKGYGHACERMENMRDSDVSLLRDSIVHGNPVIVSAEMRIFDRRLFHQVLLTGVRETSEGVLDGFYYHDPASLSTEGGKDLYASLPVFFLSWRKMAIFPKKGV